MKFTILLLCSLFCNIILSQSHPYEVRFSHEIEKGVSDGSIRPNKAGLLYSLIGEYHLSNTYSDIPVSWGVDSLDFSKYTLEEALPIIISQAKDQQIVIISENHLKPQHRIFAKRIIVELANHGFTHLGLEAFANINNENELLDRKLQERGYPLDSPLTGTYTLEPRMGELVRSALKKNYQLFAYERSEKIKGMDRDEILADNLIKYLSNHPEAKFIILCGFHHAIESNELKYGKTKWMAKHLKDKTGIDPLTIYQDNFTEKYIHNEHPILQKVIISEPSLFVNAEGKIVMPTENVDIEVVHPKTNYLDGRPNWLFENDTYRSVSIEKNDSLSYPILVSAYNHGEQNSVPIDRIELKHKYDSKKLVLPTGNYRIVLTDGTNQFEYEVNIQ